MNNADMNVRQLCALSFCAFTVPAIVLLPRAGWLWGGITAVGVAVLVLFLHSLCRKNGGGLADAAAKSVAGKIVLALLLLWNFVLLGAGARLLCGVFPEGNVLIGLLLLLLAVYAAARGVTVLARVGAICFFFFIILYGILFGFSLPQLETRWLVPVLHADWTLLPAALLPTCALYFSAGREAKGLPCWLIGGLLLTVLAGVVTAGSVSPERAVHEAFPFYGAAKSVSILGAMERLEPLVSAALTAGGFCMLGLVCALNAKLFFLLLPSAERYVPTANFLVGGTFLWVSALIPGAVLAGGTAIFWGIFPVLLPFLGARKKA